MKTKILLFATIALAVGACKTVKQSQSATLTNSTDVTVNQSSETNNDLKLKIDSSKLIIDKGQVSEVITEETVMVVYAPVDSTGKQAVVSITTTKRGVTRNENKNLQENKKGSTDVRDNSDYKSGARVVASSENEIKHKATTETKPTRTNTALWVVLILLLVAGLIVWRAKPVWFSVAYKWVLKVLKK